MTARPIIVTVMLLAACGEYSPPTDGHGPMDYAVECIATLERAKELVSSGVIQGDAAAMDAAIARWWRPAARSFFSEWELRRYLAHLRSFDAQVPAEQTEASARQCLAGPDAMPR